MILNPGVEGFGLTKNGANHENYQYIREENLVMKEQGMYEWIIRFKDNKGSVQETGGLMIANSSDEVMGQLRFDYGYDDDIEFKIKKSGMSVVPVPGHGIIYKTLWTYKLSKEEVENGICGNDIFQDDNKDVIFISNHPVKERIIN